MDTKQTLKVVDKYFNTLEIFGSANRNDFITLLYLMFIDEYYETNRDISLHDIENDEAGLTDCLVKALNANLQCLKDHSNILQGIDLDYLPTKAHWVIPDSHYEEPVEPTAGIENKVLTITDSVSNKVLMTSLSIANKILQI